MTKCLWLALALVAAACTKPAAPEYEATSAAAPVLPKHVVWTDGHHPVAVSSSGAAQCLTTSPAEAAQALAQTNAVRARAGLPALRTNARLQAAAEGHACDMARRGTMTHVGSTTSGPAARVKAQGYRPSITAENIAAGAAGVFDLDGTLAQWSASPGHRANILLPMMREYGVGEALSADGRTAFWAAVYSDPR